MPKTWSGLLASKEEEILDALKSAYRKSLERQQADSGYRECVSINRNGKVTLYTLGPGMNVWPGEAKQIACFRWQDPADGIDAGTVAEFVRASGRFDEFAEWLGRVHGYALEEAESGEGAWYLKVWDEALYKEFLEPIIDYLVEVFDAEAHYYGVLDEAGA